KDDYSFNEMLILDDNLLMQSDEFYFIPIDLNIIIKIKDETGNTIYFDRVITVDTFRPTFKRAKDALVFKSFKFVVGCQEEKKKIPNNLLGSDNNKVLFDNDIIRTLGDACIDIQKTGKFDIFAELTNNL